LGEYIYVSKNEYKSFRDVILNIIQKLQDYLRKNGKYTFTFHSIGSARVNLVTWSKENGYDLDYQLVLKYCEENDPKKIREDFIQAARELSRKMNFKVENKVHVFKITTQDEENELVLSCDIAIINKNANCDQIIVHDKKLNRYIWNTLPTFEKIEKKQEAIKREGFWNEFRDEYLKLKNNNRVKHKHSYQLRIETTNNIWERYFR